MASFFEPDTFLLDPTSYDESPTSFLSFSSFSDLARPFDLLSWDGYRKPDPPRSDATSDSSSPRDPFELFEPKGPVGIFVGPTLHTAADANPSSSHSYRSSSTDWDDPVTPALTNRSSVESFASTSTVNPGAYKPGYSWDEASIGLGTANFVQPHRTASNPTLNRNQPRVPRNVASMPSLREEETSAWFDGTEQVQTIDPLEGTAAASSLQVSSELVDGFDWVFGDYGLGEIPESTIFDPSSTETLPPQWLPTPAQDATEYLDYTNLSNFTIDPMSIMAPPVSFEDEPSRPSSAPGCGKEGMLSVPLADAMTRSVSSDCLSFARQPRDLFSYAPQQIPNGPPAPQPLYTTEPSQSYNYPRSMPLTPSHTRRASAQGLSIQIQPTFTTYAPPLPPTPQSSTFGDFSSQQAQAVQMTRAGTQPLPTTRRLSGAEPAGSKMPAHLVRAQAIVQMQEAKEEAQRQEMRRLSASRRVGMAQASVMQPQFQPQPQIYHPPRQTIMGWEGPSAQTGTLPVLTTAPLVNVHPPAYTHKVHPPPHPGTRQVNKLPSPGRQRKVSASPRRTPTKKRQANPGGGFSWGETTFINFTSDDAEKLLTGVAPSGSQGKRKREEGMEEGAIEMVRDGSKRSRSGDQL